MIVLRKPSEKRIERFLDDQRSLPFPTLRWEPRKKECRQATLSTTSMDGWGPDTRRSHAPSKPSEDGRCTGRDGPNFVGPRLP
jgi:hypothetical protein